MSEPHKDNSDLGENQGLESEDQPGEEELAKIQAQLSASSNEARLVNEVNKVLLSPDFEYFSELLIKDRTMSERVIDKIANQKGIEKEEVRKLLVKNAETQISPYDLELKIKETISKQEGEKILAEFIEKVGLNKDKELSEEFMSNFNDYMEGKTFNLINVKKFSKSAYRDLNEDKVKAFEKKKLEIEAQISSGGDYKKTETKKEGRNLLKNSNLQDW